MSFRRALMAGFGSLIAGMLLMATVLQSPSEITRLRNSLIAQVGGAGDFDWPPSSPPHDYQQETKPAPDEFLQVARAGGFVTGPASLASAVAIGMHMTRGSVTTGVPVQSDSISAYKDIVEGNSGYCSDYTQLFNALNLAAGNPVREWGMSFDGFSGQGHAFSEIYDRELEKWVFIDTFYSFYVVDSDSGVPLSVLEFREQLLSGDAGMTVSVVPVDKAAYAFTSDQKAIDYYRKGADQFFLWFGNNIFTYESNPLVAFASRFGREVEQAVAILAGVHPQIRIMPSDSGVHWVERLDSTRQRFALASGLSLLGCGFLAYAAVARRRINRRR